jgi:hypothetical protein
MTPEAYQALLVEEFANATITANISRYWALSAAASDRLTFLQARIYILDLALTGAIGKVSFKALDGASVQLSDYFDHLLAIRNLAKDELVAAMSGDSTVAVGLIQKTAPIMSPNGIGPDGNDSAYRGGLYAPRRRIIR